MKRRVGIVHGVATCDTCGELNGHYRNIQALAARHAKLYAHKVLGDVGIAYNYDGRDEKPTIKKKKP